MKNNTSEKIGNTLVAKMVISEEDEIYGGVDEYCPCCYEPVERGWAFCPQCAQRIKFPDDYEIDY